MVTRTILLCLILLTALVSGCDPAGLRRVQLQLFNPKTEASAVTVNSANTQEALQILDAIVVRHGFKLIADYSTQSEHGYVRLYSMSVSSTTADGHSHTRTIPCYVRLTSNGIQVEFGEMAFVWSCSAADAVFAETYSAFVQKYGKQNVKRHVLL